MDPLAHTLFGATLAESGLKRKTALATGALIIGANLPDIDAVALLWGNDYALLIRRGWTHGVLAMIILPFLLTGILLLYDQFRRRNRLRSTGKSNWPGPPVRSGPLLLISFLGVWSHPLLDWLNTYGVRLLAPFSDTWYYGDILFIIDPWVWLLLGAAVVLARSESKLGIAGWIVLGAATTALITGGAVVPTVVKILWCVGVGVIIVIRWLGWFRGRMERVAAACLAAFGLYLVLMFAGSRMAAWHADEHFAQRGITIQDIMVDPIPARIFMRGGIAASEGQYYRFLVKWTDGNSFELTGVATRVQDPNPIVRAALNSPEVEGLRNWIRFPHYEVNELDDGWRVVIRDLRFVDRYQEDPSGIGMAVVYLDEHLEPR